MALITFKLFHCTRPILGYLENEVIAINKYLRYLTASWTFSFFRICYEYCIYKDTGEKSIVAKRLMLYRIKKNFVKNEKNRRMNPAIWKWTQKRIYSDMKMGPSDRILNRFYLLFVNWWSMRIGAHIYKYLHMKISLTYVYDFTLVLILILNLLMSIVL